MEETRTSEDLRIRDFITPRDFQYVSQLPHHVGVEVLDLVTIHSSLTHTPLVMDFLHGGHFHLDVVMV